MLIPKITYLANMQTIEKEKGEDLERCIFDFWDGKKDKVKRKTVIGMYEKGELQLRDLESHIDMIRVGMVKRLTDCSEEN